MLTIIFSILMIVVFGKLLFWGLKAAWGLTKIVLFIVFLPLILIMMAAGVGIIFALPILIIIGVISLIAC